MAIFSSWNPKLPAKVTLWSKNFILNSWNSSHLNVPILTNAFQRQPQNVGYNDTTKSIHWDDPIEKNNLIGYTLYWCLKSSISTCNSSSWLSMQSYSLRGKQNHLEFASSLAGHNKAVEADYSDGISVGTTWILPASEDEDLNILAVITCYDMVIIAIFKVLIVIIFKKTKTPRSRYKQL
nr:uncharacterized protein LOC108077976 [Drosophila kikkawai]